MKKLFLFFAIYSIFTLYAGELFYIHGYLNDEQTGFDKEKELLKDIYPEYKITVKIWEAKPIWLKGKFSFDLIEWWKAKERAEEFSNVILNDIMDMPEKEQQDLVIVGHSLGGRCAAYLASKLKKNNIKVKRIILLGAAIEDDAQCLYDCGAVSRLKAKNLYCQNDLALRTMEKVEKITTAGRDSIAKSVEHENMDEYECDGPTKLHLGTFYLRRLKDILI